MTHRNIDIATDTFFFHTVIVCVFATSVNDYVCQKGPTYDIQVLISTLKLSLFTQTNVELFIIVLPASVVFQGSGVYVMQLCHVHHRVVVFHIIRSFVVVSLFITASVVL